MYKSTRIHIVVVLFMLAVLGYSCDSGRVFEENVAINNHQWDIKQIIKLQTKISDTLTRHNIYINVRNGGNYKYSNLYLFIYTTMPGGKKISDTLECILADDNGKWLGKGTGQIIDHRIPFKKNVLFSDTGNYIFEIEQAMRVEKLPEIYDIGLRIEKVEK